MLAAMPYLFPMLPVSGAPPFQAFCNRFPLFANGVTGRGGIRARAHTHTHTGKYGPTLTPTTLSRARSIARCFCECCWASNPCVHPKW